MGVDVNEARRQHQARQIDLLGARDRTHLADAGDDPVDHFDVGRASRRPCAVDQHGPSQYEMHLNPLPRRRAHAVPG
ncbi:unannotated protein [freshwater metagenome]|uniref:Unannotated protein n=1 Tax=freshwater metagenome TaxID=449393 RepID=A0A6J7JH86_9ZZZZ